MDQFVRASAIERDETIVESRQSRIGSSRRRKALSATYSWPCQSHASLGPSCAVADATPDGATIWTATQGTYGLRDNLAKVFGMPAEKLRVIYLDGSGSYGGNGNDDVAADALLLSRKLGRPVRVQWMRQDEHGWDPKGPPQLLDLQGGIDAQGKIVAWQTQMWIPVTVPGNRPLLAADAANISQPHGQGTGRFLRTAIRLTPSTISRWFLTGSKQTPLRPSNLRAPGQNRQRLCRGVLRG